MYDSEPEFTTFVLSLIVFYAVLAVWLWVGLSLANAWVAGAVVDALQEMMLWPE